MWHALYQSSGQSVPVLLQWHPPTRYQRRACFEGPQDSPERQFHLGGFLLGRCRLSSNQTSPQQSYVPGNLASENLRQISHSKSMDHEPSPEEIYLHNTQFTEQLMMSKQE